MNSYLPGNLGENTRLRDLAIKSMNAGGRNPAVAGLVGQATQGYQATLVAIKHDVARGLKTTTVAKREAAEAAQRYQQSLASAVVEAVKPGRPIQQLTAAAEARKKQREAADPVAVGRRTNQLLEQLLQEQALASRAASLESRTMTRGMNGEQAVTVPGLLALHREFQASGDEVGVEFVRRRLVAFQGMSFDSAEAVAVDEALARPSVVSPTVAARMLEGLRNSTAEAQNQFLSTALAKGDSTMCAAFWLFVREQGDDLPPLLAMQLQDMPEGALDHLTAMESAAYQARTADAQTMLQHVATTWERDARLEHVKAPTEQELADAARGPTSPMVATIHAQNAAAGYPTAPQ